MISYLLLFILPFTLCRTPVITGHRGGFIGVENTIECFKNGITDFKFEGLECDVHVTLDGVYVINHDNTLKGSLGTMVIEQTKFEDLKKNKLTQIRGGITYHGEICTFEEYLALIAQHEEVFPVIEIKTTTGMNNTDMSNFPGLLKLVKKYNLEKKSVFISFMRNAIDHIVKNYPELKVQHLCDVPKSVFGWCKEHHVNISANWGHLTKEDITMAKEAGLGVAVWTVNDYVKYEQLKSWGAYMITTDKLRIPPDQKIQELIE